MKFPTEWKNKTCSKPPTRYGNICEIPFIYEKTTDIIMTNKGMILKYKETYGNI